MNCSEYDRLSAGQVHLVNRVKYVACLPTLGWLASRHLGSVLTESVMTGVTQTLQRDIIPICSSKFSPMDCQRMKRHTKSPVEYERREATKHPK